MKKKRVAIYYENRLGRSDGFSVYAWNLLREMKELEVVHLIPNGDYKKFGKFDLHLIIDWGEDGLTKMLPYDVVYPKPFTYFASDTHLGYDYRLATAKQAKHVFVAQEEGWKKMKKDGVKNAHLLYHGVEPRAFPDEPKAFKKYDVSFVGHLVSEERIDFLEEAFKKFPNFWFGTRLSRYIKDEKLADDCADIFKKSKVVLNPPTKGDVNMRVFEALSTGSFLITQRVPGIESLFEDKKHLVLYDTTAEAMKKIAYYLKHEKEREKIAEAGRKLVLDRHTYKQRLETMLMVGGILPKGSIKLDHFNK